MLTAQQTECAELMATGDYNQTEIAKKLKVSKQTVSNWKKDKEFMDAYDAILRTKIKGAASKAFQTEVNLLNARSELVRFNAAKDILDRAGYKPEDNINLTGSGTVVIVDDCDQ